MFNTGNVWATRIGAIVVSAIVNLVWFGIAKVADANLRVSGDSYGGDNVEVVWSSVLFASLSWGVGALVVFLIIDRWAPNPRTWWYAIGVVGFLLSYITLFSASDNTTTTLVLGIMHVISAVIIVPAFAMTIRANRALATGNA